MRRLGLVLTLLAVAPAFAADPPATKPALGRTPKATPETLAKFNQFVEAVVDPEHTLDMVAGRPRLIQFKHAPTQIQVADPTLLSANFLKPTDLSVMGRRVGTTVLNLWFPDPARKGQEVVLSYLVRVIPDPEAKARLVGSYRVLGLGINRALPNSRVEFTIVGDKVLLTGRAHDGREVGLIDRMAK
jgi:pilus assembly protein CpaC